MTECGVVPEFAFEGSDFKTRAVSPFQEMGAYEALWCKPDTTFKSLSKLFAQRSSSVPSDFVSPTEAHDCGVFVKQRFEDAEINRFGVSNTHTSALGKTDPGVLAMNDPWTEHDREHVITGGTKGAVSCCGV